MIKTESQLQHERLLDARASQAKLALEEEIAHCSASTQEKAFLRQKLAHLWTLVRTKAVGGSP